MKTNNPSGYSSFKDILEVIAKAALELKTIKIYYPETEHSKAGWREIEPYSLATDIGYEGEHLIYNQDRIAPGHILNAYSVKSNDNHCDSFILGKIKDAKPTGKKFAPRNNWKVEF